MTAKWERSLTPQLDISGIPLVGAKARFFNAGTTTPRAVYSDANLTTIVAQPVLSQAGGLWPLIFTSAGVYKYTLTDADEVPLPIDGDNTDPGLATSNTGVLAKENGGTGATTAAGARIQLGAAAQADVDLLSNQVSLASSGVTSLTTLVNQRLPLAGGTLTGPLVLAANAVNPLEAVPKQQLDAAIGVAADFKLITTLVVAAGAGEAAFDLSAAMLQGYRYFEITLAECRPTATAFMFMEASPNNTSWVQSGYNGNLAIGLLGVQNFIAPTTSVPLTHTSATRDQQSGSAFALSGRVFFYADGTVNKAFTVETSYPLSGGPPDLAFVRGTIGASITAPLNRVKFYYSATTFASGRIQIWGRK